MSVIDAVGGQEGGLSDYVCVGGGGGERGGIPLIVLLAACMPGVQMSDDN